MGESLTDIAIVGMAGRFPGARNVEDFWRNLCAGVESITRFSPAELEVEDAAALSRMPNYVLARAIVEDADKFDAAFFDIYPKEAELIDPQQRIFLECCWHAFEDAGYDPLLYKGAAAVFAGCSFNSYFAQHVLTDRASTAKYAAGYQVSNFISTLGSNFEFLPTRVAYKLNLKGPAYSMNCGCSTSLVAVGQACLSLQNYQCDMALAGGVSITFPQKRGYLYEPGGMVSPDGHCRAFDEAAAGTVFGDGAAVVLLKRLTDAIADGDQIYAVVKGFGINNDGAAKVGFTAPGVDGQARAIAMAHAAAGVDAASISYVEAHGTGTPLGDPIEIAALTQTFRRVTAQRQFCAIGTAKTNVGHLDVAAGVTGLIKTALSLRHRLLPATLHFQRPNPRLNLEQSPFYVNAKLTEWQRGTTPLRAGVSAFGVGGTNAHLVLEEAPTPTSSRSPRGAHLILLSAKTDAALETMSSNLATQLAAEPAIELADVANTLMTGRHSFASRRMVVSGDTSAAARALIDDAAQVTRRTARSEPLPVAFMFPGQGSQYLGMGRQLYAAQAAFRAEVDNCLQALDAGCGPELASLFRGDGGSVLTEEQIDDTAIAQPALFIIEYALARLWMRWGIQPRAMIGHSVGEFTAACLAGVFPPEDALRLVAARGSLMHDLPRGAMLSVRLGEDQIARFIDPNISLAAINSPSLTVVAGTDAAIAGLERRLETEGIVCRRLRTSHAFHSSMMEPALEPFSKLLDSVRFAAPSIPFLSGVTGDWITDREATDLNYWTNHLRLPVKFSNGVARLRDEDCALLEVGPGNILSVLARQHAASIADQLVVQSLPHRDSQQSEEESVLHALGELWLHGAEADWSKVYSNESRRRVSLPLYPFEKKRFWSGAAKADDETQKILETATPDAQDSNYASTAVQSMDTMPMQNAETDDRRGRILKKLESIFEDLSGIDFGAGKAAATFLELGLDSLFLTQVSQALQSKFGIKITFRQLLDQLPTLDALASYLDENLGTEVPPAISLNGKAHKDSRGEAPTPAAAEFAQALIAEQTVVRAEAASGDLDLESLFKNQLRTLSDLMTKQLEALRGAKSPARSATAQPATAAAVAEAAPEKHLNGTNGAGTFTRRGPTSRKFIPFGPVQASRGRGLTATQSQHLSAMVERYNRKTAGSKRFTAEHRSHLADPRVAAGFRLEWKEIVYPIVTVRSSGSKIWDVDGNEYIDLVNGYGPIMFGHAPEFVTSAIREQLEHGYETGPQSPLAGEVADLICEFTGMDRVTFCNTGSEAVTAALRVARTITARDKIVLFTGAYHGMFDEVVVKGVKGPNGLRSLPVAPGIPREKVENVTVLDYGTPEALNYIETHAHELAAVLVEPVQSRHPALRPIEFLKQVRRITEQSGTALIFDEVVTGFRVHPGGCQALFGIKADLATYGKVLGGGMPIGVLAGRAGFMDALDGGMWNYGDESYPETGVTFFAGTFVRHPLAMAATLAVLKHLKNAGPDLWTQLENKTARMADALNAILQERQVPAHVDTFGSIAALTFPAELTHAGLLYYYLRERGMHVQEGFPLFLTTAHSDEDIARIVEAFKESILEMQAADFLPAPVSTALPTNGRVTEPSAHTNGHGPRREENPRTRIAPIAATAPSESTGVRRAPITESQLEILLAAKLSDEASCAFNESFTLKLRGELDLQVLGKALNSVIERHDALRASFSEDNQHQEFANELALNLAIDDLSKLSEVSRCSWIEKIDKDEARGPFDLSHGPLVRARLVKLSEREHYLIFTSHHSVCDGWSTNVILDELSTLYSAMRDGRSGDLPAAMSFSAYAESQQRHFASAQCGSTENYWLEQFKRPVPLLDLPLDRPRPSVRSNSGATRRRHVSSEIHKAIKRAGAQHKCTLFATLLAGFQVLLSRLSGQDDIVVGIPAAGQSILEDATLVGHCVNFLPLRADLAGDPSMSEFLTQVRRTLLDAYEHQNYTYGRLIQKLAIQRDPSRLPLVEVQFNLERIGTGMNFSGLEVEVGPNAKAFVNQDLFLNVIESDDGLVLDCDYNTGLFEAATIDRWLGHYETLLKGIAADANQPVSRLPLLSEAETRQITVEWNNTQSDYPKELCVHQLLEEQARRTPDSIAVVCEGVQLTYAELNEKANQLAAYLAELGVGVGSLVGVFVERSVEMLVALMGVLKAGGAYVPMDPTYPAARIAFVLEDAKASVLLTQKRLIGLLPTSAARVICLDADWEAIARAKREDRSISSPGSEELAYVIYTSGSTGKPKGVEIPHRAAVNLLCSMRKKPGIKASDILLAVTTLSFDIAALELFLPLSVGAKVVIVSRATASDGSLLLAQLISSKATVIQATPVTFRLLIEAGWSWTPALTVLCGGEALPRDLADQLLERSESVWNMYGPTETTIWSSAGQVVAGAGPVTIAPPIDNTQFYVLDARGELAPIGRIGELYIGGDGLARGYYNRPDLTAEKFVYGLLRERPEARLYRTGDMVRLSADGELQFFGRADNQIKLRGFRIELGEIEGTLLQHPTIRQAVVSVHEDPSGHRRLIAYLVTEHQPVTVAAMREFLLGKLPDYMVPSAVVLLDAMPLTPNGKVDRGALRPPDAAHAAPAKEFVAPRTDSEKTMADIWASVLRLERVGITDDLFELGADSLHIFQIAARANKEGIRIAPALFLKHRTIGELIAHIGGGDIEVRTLREMPVIARVSRDKYRVQRSALINESDRRNGSA